MAVADVPYGPDAQKHQKEFAAAVAAGASHPAAFAKAFVNLEALRKNGFAYWAGNVLPSMVLTVETDGTGALLRGGEGMTALERAGATTEAIASKEGTGVLEPGEAGSYSDLQARGQVGDQLTPHHMPQAAAGYTEHGAGGALSMEQKDHVLTRTYGFAGARTLVDDANLTFRQVLAKDIWDVRSIVGTKYNSGLLALIDYYRTNFPGVIARGVH
jgi:hypothetical protein